MSKLILDINVSKRKTGKAFDLQFKPLDAHSREDSSFMLVWMCCPDFKNWAQERGNMPEKNSVSETEIVRVGLKKQNKNKQTKKQ